jgi:hypothetical protein
MTASGVTLRWTDGDDNELYWGVWKRDNTGTWRELKDMPTVNSFGFGTAYSYTDSSSNPGGDCYGVLAENNIGGDFSTMNSTCGVRSDPTLFPQTVTPAVTQWENLDSRNGFTNFLTNTVRNQFLSDQHQTFGVNLGWTTNPNNSAFTVTAEGRLGGQIYKGEDFALKIGPDGYQHFNGFALVTQSSPSYEWRSLGGDPQQPTVSAPAPGQGDGFRSLNYGVFALWNDAAQDFLVNGVNVTGGPGAASSANLAWYKQTMSTPPPSTPGARQVDILNCVGQPSSSLSQPRTISIWAQDATTGSGYAKVGDAATDWEGNSCIGAPFVYNPPSTDTFRIVAVDDGACSGTVQPNAGCNALDPFTFKGDPTNGVIVPITVG